MAVARGANGFRVFLLSKLLLRWLGSTVAIAVPAMQVALAESVKVTYPGVIISNRSTAANEASVHAAAASFAFPGLSAERLASGASLVKGPATGVEGQGPVAGRRNLCRTARVRRIMARVRGHANCSENLELTVDKSPNDPMYESGLWGMKMMGAPAAWDVTTGTSQAIIAVVDTGIYPGHPDLAKNFWTNPLEIPNNNRDDDANGYIDDVVGMNAITRVGSGVDDNGHGTHVAGTIGAVGNNAEGVVGLNWSVRLMSAKFLSASGSGSTADAIRAIEYIVAAKKKGHNVVAINNSWGGGGFSQPLLDSINNAGAAGILFVAAAGNSSRSNDATPSYPASYRASNIIAVASITSSGTLSSFSNYGFNSVHIAAPGSSILSTVPPDRYAVYNGTSMACPHVTGLAALAYAACPTLSMQSLKGLILNNGMRTPALASKVSTGSIANAAGTVLMASANCSSAGPTPTPSPTPTATYTPDPSITPTPTPTPTATPLPTSGYLFAEPSIIPAATKTNLNISVGKKTATAVSLRWEFADQSGTRYSCERATIVALPTGTRKIELVLPPEAKFFPAIQISFATLKDSFSTRLYQTGTESTLVPSIKAAQLCQKLTAKPYL